jgi:hypothetical protein
VPPLALQLLSVPTIAQTCTMVEQSDLVGLPEPGEVYLVALVRRNHGLNPEKPDPWDDRVGILRRHPVGFDAEAAEAGRSTVPAQRLPLSRPLGTRPRPLLDRLRTPQFLGSPEDGVLEWWSCRGTAEPGWNPMYRKGNIATHKDGCARYAVPQFARDTHGGGFHHYLPDRPAFRQVGPAHIERFDETTGVWHDAGQLVIAAHAHTISPNADWQKASRSGVDDWSHACLVVLRPDDHAELLERGGWTADINGCRLSLLTLLWPEPSAVEDRL